MSPSSKLLEGINITIDIYISHIIVNYANLILEGIKDIYRFVLNKN